jgi:hypothetical protein
MLGIQDETDDDAQPLNISAHANTPLNRTMTQYPTGGDRPLPPFFVTIGGGEISRNKALGCGFARKCRRARRQQFANGGR